MHSAYLLVTSDPTLPYITITTLLPTKALSHPYNKSLTVGATTVSPSWGDALQWGHTMAFPNLPVRDLAKTHRATTETIATEGAGYKLLAALQQIQLLKGIYRYVTQRSTGAINEQCLLQQERLVSAPVSDSLPATV